MSTITCKNTILVAAAAASLLAVPFASCAAGVKPHADYSQGLAIEETAVCYAKAGNTVCRASCVLDDAYETDARKAQEQALLKILRSDPVYDDGMTASRKVSEAARAKVGKALDELEQKKKALEARMADPDYILIREDQVLHSKYQAQIKALAPMVDAQIKLEIGKEQDALSKALAAYVRGGAAADAAKTGADLQKEATEKFQACKASCDAVRVSEVAQCKKDHEVFRRERCDADYADGVQYCEQFNAPAQVQAYLACNTEYAKARSVCYAAKSRYTDKNYLYNQGNQGIQAHKAEWPAALAQFMDDQDAAYQRHEDAVTGKMAALNADLAQKVAGADAFIKDWVRAWLQKSELGQRASADTSEVTGLELARIKAVIEDNALKVADLEMKFIKQKRSQFADKMPKGSKPLSADPTTEGTLGAQMDQKSPKPPAPAKDTGSLPQGWLGWGFNKTLDALEYVPKLGDKVKALRDSGERKDSDFKTDMDNNISQEQKANVKFARNVGWYVDKLTALSPIPLPLPPVGQILEAGIQVYSQDTQQTDSGGDGLSRSGSPGLKFQDAWNGDDKGKSLVFQLKDKKGNNKDVVTLPTGPYWRQHGKDSSAVIWLWPIASDHEMAAATTPYKLRLNQESHVVDLLKVNEYLDEKNGKAVKVRELELLGTWKY